MKMIPIGIEDFRELRENNYYYVDKTSMIADLLKNLAKVTLFTRPRRFGKTLNMSMLRYFFETGSDPALFKGLAIEQERELWEKYQGKYPVISLSLKSVEGADFEEAVDMLIELIVSEADRHYSKMDHQAISPRDLISLNRLMDYDMKRTTLKTSLRRLSGILYNYYKKPVILLIDEYDVPLDKAYGSGYYTEMVNLIRGLFDVLKTNENLAFGILTGCLRISKEGIFTGLNNFDIYTVTDELFGPSFGFTEGEVRGLLEYYSLQDKEDIAKKWYDGYLFGRQRVYCPWSVLNYVKKARISRAIEPQAFWKNSSGNSIIRRFAEKSSGETRAALEKLIAGGSVKKIIAQELTYDEIEDSMDNLWSVLFLTGYLTCKTFPLGREMELVIPNREIHEIYTEQIEKWFADVIRTDSAASLLLCRSLVSGNAAKVEAILNDFLLRSISVRDTMTRAPRENFYHGILLGLLGNVEGWTVQSNPESGYGWSDLIFRANDLTVGIVLEIKYGWEKAEAALAQIEERQYDAMLAGYDKVLKYGIAFEGKRCRVLKN